MCRHQDTTDDPPTLCQMQQLGKTAEMQQDKVATPLINGLYGLASAEQASEIALVLAKEHARLTTGWPMTKVVDAESEVSTLVCVAIHIEHNRLDRSKLPVCQGRELLMAGAAALLSVDASLESHDAMRLFALLLDKLLRGGRGSHQAKQDGLTITTMEQRALAIRSLNVGVVVRGSWRRKACSQLGHASWLDVVEAALWCFWHSDDFSSGEALLGVLPDADNRVRLVYGMLAGAFYLAG